MNRNNVFKLSGNMALGNSNQTYSTAQLQNIKSSLRLLKARQSQKKSQQLIDLPNNYLNANPNSYKPNDFGYGNNTNYNNGGPYSSNVGQRAEIRKPSQSVNKQYNYFQNNATNHIPTNDQFDKRPLNLNNRDSSSDNRPSIHVQQQKNIPIRDRGNNYSSMSRNQYQLPSNNAMKQVNGNRRVIKNNTYNDQIYDNYNQNNNGKKLTLDSYNNQKQKQKEDNFNNKDLYSQNRPPLRKQQQNNQNNVNTNNNFNSSSNNNNNKGYSQANNNNKDFQQKAIKQINQQNKPQIVEYDPSSFVQCSVGCGRKFNPQSLAKHQNICMKVFQKKRKQFNVQQQRIINDQHQKYIQQAQQKDKYQLKKNNNNKAKQTKNQNKNQKMSKWKAQSLAFRAMLKQNNGQQMSKQEKLQVQQAKNTGMVKCPYCGRSFNQTAGPKHITFCQNQSKKGKFKK